MAIWVALLQLPQTGFALASAAKAYGASELISRNSPSGGRIQDEAVNRNESSAPTVYLVKVPLPITARVATDVARTLQQLRDKSQAELQGEQRPVVLLQFETERGGTGVGSSLTACLELAQLLTSPEMNRLKTLAYIPRSINLQNAAAVDGGNAIPSESARLAGHAVLVAIAAEQLVIDETAKFGPANNDEPQLNPLAIDIYRNVAERRLNLPVEIVTALIDPRQSLYLATTAEGDRLVNQETLQSLEREGKILQAETLSAAGATAEFSSTLLSRLSVNVQVIASREQLANRLGINLQSLEAQATDGRQWKAVEYRFADYLDQRSVDWAIRAIDQAIRAEQANLVVLSFDLFDADINAALRLATYLASLDRETAQSVAFVEGPLNGPAAMCALLCDQLLLTEAATLGGEFAPPLSADQLQQASFELKEIAQRKQRSYSLLYYQIDPQAKIVRWRNQKTGEIRWMSEDEQQKIPENDVWQALETLSGGMALTAEMADRDGLARAILRDRQELDSFYQLAAPVRALTPTRTDRVVQWLARSLASPTIAFWLLFGGMFLISTEMSSPGLGVPGFFGTLCFVLFFWSQYLGGNAGWLEILLFVIGVVFVGMELFVLPGFGVFGIGGLLLIVVSIVLASQTFIIPQNAAEFRQLPVSLGMVCGALLGFLSALYFIRKYLPHTPYLKKLMLEPPTLAVEGFNGDVEANPFPPGIRGKTLTKLMPSGKARIAGRVVDVLTDGRIVEPLQTIEVVEAVGNRIVVVPVEDK